MLSFQRKLYLNEHVLELTPIHTKCSKNALLQTCGKTTALPLSLTSNFTEVAIQRLNIKFGEACFLIRPGQPMEVKREIFLHLM